MQKGAAPQFRAVTRILWRAGVKHPSSRDAPTTLWQPRNKQEREIVEKQQHQCSHSSTAASPDNKTTSGLLHVQGVKRTATNDFSFGLDRTQARKSRKSQTIVVAGVYLLQNLLPGGVVFDQVSDRPQRRVGSRCASPELHPINPIPTYLYPSRCFQRGGTVCSVF